MGGVLDGDGIEALSLEFGVASTLYLGAEDVIKLRTALDEHALAPETLLCVLGRLKMLPLTRELCGSTAIDEHVFALREHADGGVAAVAARIVETWAAQLQREPRKSAVPKVQKVPPKPKCKACAGQKRPHSCGDKGKAACTRVSEEQ